MPDKISIELDHLKRVAEAAEAFVDAVDDNELELSYDCGTKADDVTEALWWAVQELAKERASA